MDQEEKQITISNENLVPDTEENDKQNTAPGAVTVREIEYTITDAFFGEFNVVKSANAWWMDRRKVENLIIAFKSGQTVKGARYYAGISEGQWKYFLEIHPEFSTIKQGLEEVQMFKAMNTINENLQDPKTARWFLDRRHPKFASKVRVETEEPLQPTTINNNVAIGTINNINAREIADAIKEVAREVFGTSEDDTNAILNEVMEGVSEK